MAKEKKHPFEGLELECSQCGEKFVVDEKNEPDWTGGVRDGAFQFDCPEGHQSKIKDKDLKTKQAEKESKLSAKVAKKLEDKKEIPGESKKSDKPK